MRRAGFFFALILITAVYGCGGFTADADSHEPWGGPEPMVHTLTTISSTTGGSIITPGEGDFAYDGGTMVDLVAEVARGYRFVKWTGDVDTIFDPDSASTIITMNDDYSITANFEPVPSVEYSLTISSTEGGEITAPGKGAFTCDAGKVVNLLAVADKHYKFTRWTGDVDYVDDIYAAETTITVWDDCFITANFELMEYTLTVDGTEGGLVTVPGEGESAYPAGTVVDLVAVAEEHYRFVGWAGDIEQIADPASHNTTISIWSAYSITANFELVEYTLTVDGTEGGLVTVPGEGESAYPAGTVVDLVAVADEHYQFVEWTGDVDGIDDVYDADTFITIWGDYSISAEFEKVSAPEVYSMGPNSGQPNDKLTVTISGANFTDRPSVNFGELIVVQQVTFVSASRLEVCIKVQKKAELGPRDVTVTNPNGQSVTLPDGFTVL